MDDRPINGAIVPSGDRPSEKMSALTSWWFSLFHGYAFIYLNLEEDPPQWRTNTRYPLNAKTLFDRWQREDQLIGVRFNKWKGGKTRYFAIDIDRRSPYHPLNSEDEFKRLLGVLESIGLCRYIRIRSSNSNGIHLYFPLPEPILCTQLSLVIYRTLEQAGFTIADGILELFPNLRSSSDAEYKGLRLPLQEDSYLLDKNWQPIHNDLNRLIITWKQCASYQDFALLEQTISKHIIKDRYTSKDLEEWRIRLESTINIGWTDFGQTNPIIQAACTYARVFLKYEWDEVEKWTIDILPSCPGYKKYCRHKHEFKKRVKDWVDTNRRSKRYYPVASKPKEKIKTAPNNEEKHQDLVQRVERAIASIKAEFGHLPGSASQRREMIRKRARCSPSKLSNYLELWHPDFDDKSCVYPGMERVSTASSDQEMIPEDSEPCVHPDCTGVSAIAKDSLKNLEINETQQNKGCTHTSLQSVYSPEESKKNKSVSELIHDIKVGDRVRWKNDNSIFQVLKVNQNGTIAAKRLSYFVPLAQAFLNINEIELIDSPHTDQRQRG